MTDEAETTLAEVSEAVDAPQVAQKPADGVAVLVEYLDNGDFKIDISCLGTTRVTELYSILSKARKTVQESLGMD